MAGSFYDGMMSPAMPRDVELALGYFHKSAAQGYRPAQYNLAVLLLSDQARDEPKVFFLCCLRHRSPFYERGWNRSRSWCGWQAFALFKELAESGEKESMLKLSWCYEEGRGGTKPKPASVGFRTRAVHTHILTCTHIRAHTQ
jgi:TPR repeat protein